MEVQKSERGGSWFLRFSPPVRLTGSLRLRMLYLSLAGLALAVLVYLVLSHIGAVLIETNYMSAESVNRRKAQIYSRFSSYVSAEGISGRDTAAVARWTASHEYVTIFLFGFGREQRLYSGGEISKSDASGGYDPVLHGKLYPIRFADGLYQIAIDDNSQLRQRQLVKIASLAAAGLSLLILHLWYTDRLTRRIIALSREAALVSSGELERHITATGRDELGALAESMDEMRRSVIARMGNETRAWEANAELITAISHDIRTPMTSLIGYLGLLNEELPAHAEKSRQFAASAYGKAMELKELTDELFKYFLVFGHAELELHCESFDGRLLLEQLLGEAEFDLADAGIDMRRIDFTGECSIETDPLYLKRVMDNLVSNVKKYADRASPVELSSALSDGRLSVRVDNTISQTSRRGESNRIGLRTCEKIMAALGGTFTVTKDREHFSAEFVLPVDKAN